MLYQLRLKFCLDNNIFHCFCVRGSFLQNIKKKEKIFHFQFLAYALHQTHVIPIKNTIHSSSTRLYSKGCSQLKHLIYKFTISFLTLIQNVYTILSIKRLYKKKKIHKKVLFPYFLGCKEYS